MNGIDSKCRNALLEMIYSPNPLGLRIADLNNADGNHNLPNGDISDYRLRDLIFHDFRTYSSGKKPYGVSLVKNDNLSSLFLIGRNGSGKSTLFTALEMIYGGNSSYAKEIKGVDLNSYLTYGFGKSKNSDERTGWQLEFKFADDLQYRTLNKDNIQELIPSSFLCSEVEIEESRNSGKLNEWILQQLGYGKLLEIKKVIERMQSLNEKQTLLLSSNELYSTDDLKELVNVIVNTKIVESLKNEISSYSDYNNINENSSFSLFPSLWKNLQANETTEGEVINMKIAQDEKNNEEIKKHIAKLYSKLNGIIKSHTEDNAWGYDDVKNLIMEIENDNGLNVDATSKELEENRKLLDEMNSFINGFSTELVSGFIQQNASDIEEVMRMFSSHNEKYKFINTEKKKIQDLEMQISVDNERAFTTSPVEYFNTFRYRLYFVTLKLALSFKWMEHTGIAAPVVIDDVFNASDFDNSIKLEYYIYFVKKIYNHICIEDGFAQPLQLIILTHDDMVFNSVKNGFCSYHAGDSENIMSERYFQTICARLYKLEELSKFKDCEGQEYNNIYL